MKTGGNRPRRVRARRKRAGIDRIYAVARQTSRSRAFTTGAGRYSFTERGEEKRRRRRRRPCFLAAEAEAEACRSLLESTGARTSRVSAPASPPGCSSPPGVRPHRTCSSCPSAPARPPPSTVYPSASYAPCLLSGLLCSPASLLFLCFFPSSSVYFPVSRALLYRGDRK